MEWEPLAGFGVGQWVQHLQCAAAPLPHTSPFPCKLLLTSASMTEGSEQSTMAREGVWKRSGEGQEGNSCSTGSKGQEVAPSQGASQKAAGWKSANSSQRKTSPDPQQAECSKNP